MPMHVRRRGQIYHARGTVRVGKESIVVPEFSTGATSRALAEAVAEAEAEKIRRDRIEGTAGRARRLTIADCLTAYIDRPGGVRPYDLIRVAEFNQMFGDRPLSDAEAVWSEWLTQRGAKLAPASAARWRAILQAALNAGTTAHRVPAVRLSAVRQKPLERAVYLSIAEQDRLLAAYNRFARPVATVLCFAGLRTQEALQLDWRSVDWKRGTLHVPKSKSGRGRTVPMHERIAEELRPIWEARGQPETGPVFLSSKRRPYRDTGGMGGNPLTKAHATACRRAGIRNFRVHDWRHHFASRLVMAGCDLFTLMRLGGWSTPRMVQKYASVSIEHMAEAVRRLG